MALIGGCEGGGEGTEGVTSKGQGPAGTTASVDYNSSRIETLKSRLFDDPDNEQLLSELGDVFFESQRFPEAIPTYEKAVAINPQNHDVLNDLGLSYFYIGETEKALDSINKAIGADPTFKHAWLSKGFMLKAVGNYDEAVVSLNKVKELDTDGTLAMAADNFLKEIETSLNIGAKGSD